MKAQAICAKTLDTQLPHISHGGIEPRATGPAAFERQVHCAARFLNARTYRSDFLTSGKGCREARARQGKASREGSEWLNATGCRPLIRRFAPPSPRGDGLACGYFSLIRNQ